MHNFSGVYFNGVYLFEDGLRDVVRRRRAGMREQKKLLIKMREQKVANRLPEGDVKNVLKVALFFYCRGQRHRDGYSSWTEWIIQFA